MTRYWLFVAYPLAGLTFLFGLVTLFSSGPIQRVSGSTFRGTYAELPVLGAKKNGGKNL
jgi:hypothetical protein